MQAIKTPSHIERRRCCSQRLVRGVLLAEGRHPAWIGVRLNRTRFDAGKLTDQDLTASRPHDAAASRGGLA
jgi:hypothetical protein